MIKEPDPLDVNDPLLTEEEMALLIRSAGREHSVQCSFGPGWTKLQDIPENEWAKKVLIAHREQKPELRATECMLEVLQAVARDVCVTGKSDCLCLTCKAREALKYLDPNWSLADEDHS